MLLDDKKSSLQVFCHFLFFLLLLHLLHSSLPRSPVVDATDKIKL